MPTSCNALRRTRTLDPKSQRPWTPRASRPSRDSASRRSEEEQAADAAAAPTPVEEEEEEEIVHDARDVHARAQAEGAEQVGAGTLGTDADAFEAQALALLAKEFPTTSSSPRRS